MKRCQYCERRTDDGMTKFNGDFGYVLPICAECVGRKLRGAL